VQDQIHDAFVNKLTAKVAAMKVGPGTEDGVTQGPLINQAALAKVQSHVADALSQGAKVQTGGKVSPLGGTFFEPTVITGVTSAMRFAKEETFGPVAPIFRFQNEAEAIAAANDTPFGLQAYFYTKDLARTFRVAEALETGIVGVNSGLTSSEGVPFGGIKQSGLGREGSHHGVEEYLELKYVYLGGIN
jgi:succinate-semialdehyde dehydrogenase/glutarate-semialdehyde dehydrogenase